MSACCDSGLNRAVGIESRPQNTKNNGVEIARERSITVVCPGPLKLAELFGCISYQLCSVTLCCFLEISTMGVFTEISKR